MISSCTTSKLSSTLRMHSLTQSLGAFVEAREDIVEDDTVGEDRG